MNLWILHMITSFVTSLVLGVLLSHPVTAQTDLHEIYDNYNGFDSDGVRILRAPHVIGHLRGIHVEYYCEDDSIIVVDVIGMYMKANGFSTLFQKAFRCKGQRNRGISKVKKVLIRLPPSLDNRPGYFNRVTQCLRTSAKVRAWMIDESQWEEKQTGKRTPEQLYFGAHRRDYEMSRIVPKLSRPFLSPTKRRQSPIWYWPAIQTIPKFSDMFLHCAVESDQLLLLNYPAVFSGSSSGINRVMLPYKDENLEAERRSRTLKPSLTIEMWVYFIEFCPLQAAHEGSPPCGLIIHMDRKWVPMSPSLLINKDGHIQVDMRLTTGFDSRLTVGKASKNEWNRIFFTLDSRSWEIHVGKGTDIHSGFTTKYSYDSDVHVDDADGTWVLGGLDPQLGSFVGYMGRVVYNRNRVLNVDEIEAPPPNHPMFELHLGNRQTLCINFQKWMNKAVHVYQRYYDYKRLTEGDVCPSVLLLFQPVFSADQCPPKHPTGLKQHRYVKRLLQRAVQTGTHLDLLAGNLEAYSPDTSVTRNNYKNISMGLHHNVTTIVTEKGFKKSKLMLRLLKQAACLGNDDAMFDLASLLNNGVGSAVDEIQSLAFFMLGTLNKHMPSTMALGHRHLFGLDGAPQDLDAGYMYYKMVADKCRWERIEHSASQIATETIRLIDEQKIEAQTSENGELFQWLKMQAEQGITSAQSQLGQMMFHGTQGLNRNLQRALDMFREGAEGGDAESMFNAGIIEFRGIGGLKANESHGKQMIEKAAEMDNEEAVGALAWMAMEHEKNYTKAFEMFNRAKKMGNMNAGYFLGHMYHHAMVPNQTEPNMDKALEQYYSSAAKGNMDAGVLFAYILSRGTLLRMRDINGAVIWARFIAETHSNSLARPLRRGLHAYRDGNNALSLYSYLCLASTGLEVASFNLAYLCEFDKEGMTSHIAKECQWRHYNLTVQREFQQVDAYSYIKMGDHSWYGCRGKRDVDMAAHFYSMAALKKDPHALFNLAYMVEEGSPINEAVWKTLHIPASARQTDTSLLLELYGRCKESKKSEAYIPCSLAYARVWATDIYKQHAIYMQVTGVLGTLVVLVSITFFLVNLIQQRRVRREAEQREVRSKKEDDVIPDDVIGEGEDAEVVC